ncbi:MAG: tetraacyldisaccharide 4'-kinase [Acidobacteriota bacterium]|nr:tetraacyldisaccharide 4'-kinase [Acidobacteriota bacterium]
MKPLLLLYSLGSRLVCRVRRARRGRGRRAERAPIPVISVGNITLGGSEKTPLAIDLLGFLLGAGFRPALVSRGYKGGWEKTGGTVSDGRSLRADAEKAGDEPVMAALNVPRAGVYVGRDRLASCRQAAADGFDVAVLDDGFQHFRLARDLDIVLIRPDSGRILREGFSALREADIVLHAGEAPKIRAEAGRPAPLLFPYRTSSRGIVPVGGGATAKPPETPPGPVLAFCGIAGPERFFAMLESLGIRPAARLVFPDHHAYPAKTLDRIATAARGAACRSLITTEKDAVKLRGRIEKETGLPARCLKIGLDLPEGFYAAVRSRLGRAGSSAR